MTDLVNKLSANNSLSKDEFSELLKFRNNETTEYLFEKALLVKEKFYGKSIYLRGIVELTNYCKITVIIVVLEGIIYLYQDTDWTRKICWDSVRQDTTGASGLLCLLGAMIIISLKQKWQIL